MLTRLVLCLSVLFSSAAVFAQGYQYQEPQSLIPKQGSIGVECVGLSCPPAAGSFPITPMPLYRTDYSPNTTTCVQTTYGMDCFGR